MIYLLSLSVVLFFIVGWAMQYHDEITGWRVTGPTILASVGIKSIAAIAVYMAAFSITMIFLNL